MKKIILILIFLINTIVIYGNIFACSCVGPIPPKKLFESSNSVFVGKVINISLFDKISSFITMQPIRVAFNVSKTGKGLENKIIVLTIEPIGSLCSYDFRVGEEYLVYYNNNDKMMIGGCSGTKLLVNAKSDLEKIGEGRKPTRFGVNNTPLDYNVIFVVFIFLVMYILLTPIENKKKRKNNNKNNEDK